MTKLPKPSGEPSTRGFGVGADPCKGMVGGTTLAGGTSRGRSASPGSAAPWRTTPQESRENRVVPPAPVPRARTLQHGGPA